MSSLVLVSAGVLVPSPLVLVLVLLAVARCCPPGRHVLEGSSQGGALTWGDPLTIRSFQPDVSILWW
ncbi:hypothetical protein [Leifsonia sp. A12D58]|uniref:hypothetical protein n=1 Tax=Leifsonia sp. A12D58 TaxID=3397674 RepID=UPI0039E13856